MEILHTLDPFVRISLTIGFHLARLPFLPSPDLCLDTILSLSSAGSSFNLFLRYSGSNNY